MIRISDEWINYRDWLIEKVGFNNSRYNKLLAFLHNLPFVYYHPFDKRRSDDGEYLREEFLLRYRLPHDLFRYEKCSVLEMLVALAIRLDNEWVGCPGDPKPELIFFEMLVNLGLDRFTTRKFDEAEVYEIVGKWLKREFDYDGNGSIFPLKDASEDQREAEIWCQAMSYINENY